MSEQKEHLIYPCYLVDEKKLIRNLKILADAKKRAGVNIILAFKAFAFWPSFKLIAKYLDGATASSLWEATLCMEEMGGKSHTYAPAYLPEDFEQLCRFSSHITFNSISEFDRHQAVAASYNCSMGLRVNPEYSTAKIELYNPAKKGSRLGVTQEELERKGLPKGIDGLHFHTLCESSAEDLKHTLNALEKRFGKYLHQVKWVNMGGGHLITRKGYDIDLLVKTLIAFREKYDVEIILEPGSAIAWDCGDLHARVLDIVNNHNIKTAILDVSFTAHMPDTLEMPYSPEVEGASLEGKGKYHYRLGGVSCLAGDYVDGYSFEKEVEVGDIIVLKDMMHYTMVKTTMFNGVRHPSIALLKSNGKINLQRKFYYQDFKNRLG